MNKKLLLLPLSMLFIFMMAGMASAAVTCTFDQTATTAGTSSSYLRPYSSDLANLSATISYSIADEGANVTDATLTNDITSTAYISNTTTFNNLSQVSNISVDLGEFLDTQVVTFTWTLYNTTGSTLATCTRSYITDLTTPGCSFASGLVSSSEYAPTQKWIVACSNASSATLQFGNNNPLVMAESSDSCTFTGDKSRVPEGTYQTLTARPSDGLNSTSCQLSSISIDIGIPLKQIAVLVASGQVGKAASAGSNNSNVALIVIIGLAAYWYVRNRKK